MNQQTANPNAVNPSASGSLQTHCRHRTRGGRFCRLPVRDVQSGLCFRHASLRNRQLDLEDVSAEFSIGFTEFKSAVSVNEFLSRLLLLQCQGRIPPRRAAVMAYTCNLLLHTLPAIDRENPIPDDAQQTVIWDIPGLDPVRGSDPAYPQSSELTHDVHANEDASSITR